MNHRSQTVNQIKSDDLSKSQRLLYVLVLYREYVFIYVHSDLGCLNQTKDMREISLTLGDPE